LLPQAVRGCFYAVVDLLPNIKLNYLPFRISLIVEGNLAAAGSFEPRLTPLDQINFRNYSQSLLCVCHLRNEILELGVLERVLGEVSLQTFLEKIFAVEEQKLF
jgi:hypothetical protein